MAEKGILIFIGLIALAGTIAALSFDTEAAIPPTPAFNTVNLTGAAGNITALSYNDDLFFTAGSNVTLTFFPANNTIRFEAAGSGGGGGGDNLGDHTATQDIELNNFWVNFTGVNPRGLANADGEYITFVTAGAGQFIMNDGIQQIFEDNNGVTKLQNSVTTANSDYQSKGGNQFRILTEDATSIVRNRLIVSPGNSHAVIFGDPNPVASTATLLITKSPDETNHYWQIRDAGSTDFQIRYNSGSNVLMFDEITAGKVDEFKLADLDFVGADGYNWHLGTGTASNDGTNTLIITQGTNPTSPVSNAIQLYANDTGGTAELYVNDFYDMAKTEEI